MNALLILIPVSLILLGIAVWAFFWAVNRGQFDDLDTPALRILEDDRPQRSVDDAVDDNDRSDGAQPPAGDR